eukprot:g12657.t1
MRKTTDEHHTCGSASQEVEKQGSKSSSTSGTSATGSAPGILGSQKHERGTTTIAELLRGLEANIKDLTTPLASAGAGDDGAECDPTPRQSCPRRGAGSSQGSVFLASPPGRETETASASEEAASASGMDISSDGEGRGPLKRKDTITWESFLANLSMRRPREASILPPAAAGHFQPGSTTDQTARYRYLEAMASNAGAVTLNNGVDDGQEGGDERSVGETASIDMPELLEGREMTPPKVPHLLSDLSDQTFSPRSKHLDLGTLQPLSPVGLGSIKHVRKTMERGINKFNVNPKDGIAYLVDNGLISDTAESICDFLSTGEGLSKGRIGEYFGRDNPKVQERRNRRTDFCRKIPAGNPDVFSCSDTAWVLAFGLMILNTDMYNRNVKECDKMTEVQFVRNHRGIDQGMDPPKELLEGMCRRIKANEILMPEGFTFVAPKKSGWLRKKSTGYVGKWKRRWFVLNAAVLYYFISPQHQDEAPRCIIPLEGMNVSPDRTTDVVISLRTNQGYVKSAKMWDNGRMVQGTHSSFVLRAESLAERDVWVEALRAEVPAFHMELPAERSVSATQATSPLTPIGPPSESGRRVSKFGTSGRTHRHSVDAEVSGQMPPPFIRGRAPTQRDRHQEVLEPIMQASEDMTGNSNNNAESNTATPAPNPSAGPNTSALPNPCAVAGSTPNTSPDTCVREIEVKGGPFKCCVCAELIPVGAMAHVNFTRGRWHNRRHIHCPTLRGIVSTCTPGDVGLEIDGSIPDTHEPGTSESVGPDHDRGQEEAKGVFGDGEGHETASHGSTTEPARQIEPNRGAKYPEEWVDEGYDQELLQAGRPGHHLGSSKDPAESSRPQLREVLPLMLTFLDSRTWCDCLSVSHSARDAVRALFSGLMPGGPRPEEGWTVPLDVLTLKTDDAGVAHLAANECSITVHGAAEDLAHLQAVIVPPSPSGFVTVEGEQYIATSPVLRCRWQGDDSSRGPWTVSFPLEEAGLSNPTELSRVLRRGDELQDEWEVQTAGLKASSRHPSMQVEVTHFSDVLTADKLRDIEKRSTSSFYKRKRVWGATFFSRHVHVYNASSEAMTVLQVLPAVMESGRGVQLSLPLVGGGGGGNRDITIHDDNTAEVRQVTAWANAVDGCGSEPPTDPAKFEALLGMKSMRVVPYTVTGSREQNNLKVFPRDFFHCSAGYDYYLLQKMVDGSRRPRFWEGDVGADTSEEKMVMTIVKG